MLVAAITLVKWRKYRKNQRNQRRRSRIFREVGMIPMTSVINERYVGPDEGLDNESLSFLFYNNK